MKFVLKSLVLDLRQGQETLTFADISYFWGQMGAGKSSIAKLIDYCLGGKIQLSPALQAEFVGATLKVELERAVLSIERQRDASNVFASWTVDDEVHSVVVPARSAAGEVIAQTDIETLSDLVFWLSGIQPPRVRKSKLKAETKMVRLSLRDLLWYCYLDQDNIDSSFFHLEEDAEYYLRLKSRDVIRYVIGYHDERVADLEAELDQLRANRTARAAAITSLTKTLEDVGAGSELQIAEREASLKLALSRANEEIRKLREVTKVHQADHAVDLLARKAGRLGTIVSGIDETTRELTEVRERHIRHRNEIEMLSLKFRRSSAARAILGGVEFVDCPRCLQQLPERPRLCCDVCGQEDRMELADAAEQAAIERDIEARRADLDGVIAAIDGNLARLRRRRDKLVTAKAGLETERNRLVEEADSAFLSTVLLKERERAALQAELDSLSWLLRLPDLLREQREAHAQIVAMEQVLREALKEARTAAEADRSSLERLGAYFLDALVQSGVPGFTRQDSVALEPPAFYPAVYSRDPADLTVSTFTSMSSGGKKTLFKCCFAIAVHRIAAQLEAPLPELLIIDSAMKNISERENREQFEGFYRMLYALKQGELASTQMILIDKEFLPPDPAQGVAVTDRHMQPDSDEHEPLIRYYRGK